MKRGLFIILLLTGSLFLLVHAQETDSIIVDNTQLEVKATELFKDTMNISRKIPPVVLDNSVPLLTVDPVAFTPDPNKSIFYSALCPGLGQIYNRRYWKLPIVYGGFLGVVYAVSWNGSYYNDYKTAYRDLALGTGDSWKDFYPNFDPDSDYARKQQIMANLRRKKDFYRRYRDLAILIGVGLYALCIIDAYVDAQLYDFNMSQDLSMTVVPMVMPPTPTTKMAVGIQCTIKF